MSTSDPIGLPHPPDVGARALPDGTYDGVTVFVTGGGTGLGRAIASEFARLGANIVVASRKPEHLEQATEAMDEIGAPNLTVECDIRDPESIAAAFDAATERFGLPGVLVNNAAANFPVPAEDMSPNAWRTVVDITLNGTYFCAREFGRRHLEANTPGSIINVGASYAWTGGPGFAHSAAAKAGVKNMVETLAVEWGPYGIQVNGLVPGLFPHEDMTADIQSNLVRTNDKDICQPALRVGKPRAGLGRHLPGVALRPVHLGPHPRGRRGQLAAPQHDQPGSGHHPGPDGQGALRAVKFSLSLPLLKDLSAPDPFRETFELAVVAEEAGFDTVTIGHHHFMAGNMADPLTFLAAVAARTSTIRVGTGIFQLPIHNPVRVAEQVATIDQISGGRISLGVGLGWWPLEYEVHGSDIRQRGARMEEALEILRLVWTEENTSYEGRFWSFPELTVHPRPVQRPHPPLWVAGVAPAAVERAARLGDAWLWGPVQSLSAGLRCLDVYRPACEALGKPADFVLRRYAWLGADDEQVRTEVLPRYVDGLMAHWRESVEEDEEKELFARIDAGDDVSPEEIAADRLLWGGPERVIAQIEGYRAATGTDHVHAAFGAGLPADTGQASLGEFDEIAEMIRLFGREVIPAFERG